MFLLALHSRTVERGTEVEDGGRASLVLIPASCWDCLRLLHRGPIFGCRSCGNRSLLSPVFTQ